MSSWVQLLLLLWALTAARLQPGSAEGDPLPASLVDLVWNSPVSSVDDLKHLLQQEAGEEEEEEEEEEEPEIRTNRTRGRFSRSLMEAQPAQQAVCKVRTEVQEVTRSMLDRRNANFMLWPPCVEVQRCSGCCNTRLLQCVPTVTSTRYLQVIKIQFINKKAHYDNAVVTVEDHVSCRCQVPSSSPSVPIPRSPAQAIPNPVPQPQPPQQPPPSQRHPQPLHPPTHPKSHTSKAELHRHDDLKHNQHRYRPLEDRDPASTRQWQQGSYTQLAHWSQTGVPQLPAHTLAAGAHTAIRPVVGSHGSWHQAEVRVEQGSDRGAQQGAGHGSGFEGVTREDARSHHPDHDERHQHQQQQQQHPQFPQQPQRQYNQYNPTVQHPELKTQYRLHALQSDSASSPGNATTPPGQDSEQKQDGSPQAPANQKDSEALEVTNEERQKQSEVTNTKHKETEVVNHKKGMEREETGLANSGEVSTTELANQRKEDKPKLTNGDRPFTEKERRQKLLEIIQREPEPESNLHPPADHRHHPQDRPKPTAAQAVVPTVAPPSRPSPPRVPFRPGLPRRRRKHRSRISKAAIRAIIM